MPSSNPKILLLLDKKLLDRLDDYRFEKRVNSRSEAVRILLDEGLKKYEKKPKK